MKINEYKKKIKTCFFFSILIIVAALVTTFVLTKDITITIISALSTVLLFVISVYLYRLNNKFTSQIVNDLSKLTDVLIQLEEQEIFPENQDTLTSKLQSKIIKLVRMFKNKDAVSVQNQENIKALVSDISHQLKTPIATLKMYTDFLSNTNITELQRKEYIDIISISVERLNFLSESMIKVSRLESGLINLRPQMQSLNQTALKAIKDVFYKAKSKNIEIAFSEDAQISIYHDRNWTAEAIFNLLENAVKYAKSYSEISVAIKKLGMFVSIEVSDKNQMIPESEQARIFQRFYRGKNSTNTEGIGVGLYLTREIAIRQGGYMNLRATETGNTFSIFLPESTFE